MIYFPDCLEKHLSRRIMAVKYKKRPASTRSGTDRNARDVADHVHEEAHRLIKKMANEKHWDNETRRLAYLQVRSLAYGEPFDGDTSYSGTSRVVRNEFATACWLLRRRLKKVALPGMLLPTFNAEYRMVQEKLHPGRPTEDYAPPQ